MQYVAHVGIKLTTTQIMPLGKWISIKDIEGIEYYWKIEHDILHIISGNYSDPELALVAAKHMYVNVFYNLMLHDISIEEAGCDSYSHQLFDDVVVDGYNGSEKFFFWPLHYNGGVCGPGVYETDQDVSCFDSKRTKWLNVEFVHNINVELNNIDKTIFTYDEEIQHYFNTICLAEKTDLYGLKMTLYCTLLEHLSGIYMSLYDISPEKDAEVLELIAGLQKEVKDTNISEANKDSFLGFLKEGRRLSAGSRIKMLCKKYANNMYEGIEIDKIISAAYKDRSTFAHGSNDGRKNWEKSHLIKNVTLDVIMNMMREKEGLKPIFDMSE